MQYESVNDPESITPKQQEATSLQSNYPNMQFHQISHNPKIKNYAASPLLEQGSDFTNNYMDPNIHHHTDEHVSSLVPADRSLAPTDPCT